MKNAISAGHQETLNAAKTILENGGNAFDAAIAAAFAMFITEPCMSSAFAGGFAMTYTKKDSVKMLDFFTQTPREKIELENRDFYPIHVNFGNEIETFHVGMASAATPGYIKGLYELHRTYGTMPMSDLLAPAKELARTGVKIDQFQHIDMGLLEVILKVDPVMKEVFFKNGERLKVGQLLKMPRLGSFLDFLEHEGERGFYHGEISQVIDSDSRERGGYLRRADFETYQSFWRKPLPYSYQNKTIYLPNGPSLGGALMALVLDQYKQNADWVNSIKTIRSSYKSSQEIENAMNETQASLEFRAKGGSISTKGTTHLNVSDKWNNAISFTCSLGEGSGYFAKGTDMQLNNMLGESFLLPNGFHSWGENTRLNSMMTPTMVCDENNKLLFAGGSGGAGRIPYMIAQVLDSLYEHNLDLQTATASPRVFVDEKTLHVEKNARLVSLYPELVKHEWDYKSLYFGGVHSLIYSQDAQIEAAGDQRRYGVAEIF